MNMGSLVSVVNICILYFDSGLSVQPLVFYSFGVFLSVGWSGTKKSL